MSILKVTTALGDLFILPHPPNSDGGETLEFYTDVLASYTNEAEVRSQMRAIPRQTLIYPYGFRYDRMMESYNAVSAGLRSRWAIPLWFENQRFVANIGQQVIAADTTLHDFRVGSLALVYTLRGDWQLSMVQSIADNTITLAAADALNVAGRAFVMPVRLGYVSGQAALKPTGYRNSTKLTYQVDDVRVGFTDAAPQYLGHDLYTSPYVVDGEGATTTTISQQDDQVEYSVGDISRSTPWVRTQYGKQYGYVGESLADLAAFKQFFYRRAGKFRDFYAPSFEANFRKASTGNVGAVFKIYDDGYSLVFANKPTIAFGLTDDTWILRPVTAVTAVSSEQAQVQFAEPLNIDASRIRVVSYAGLNRLDTDRVEITLEVGGRSRANYNVLEL